MRKVLAKVERAARKEAAAQAQREAQVRNCLERLLRRVEDGVKRSEGIWLGILARTVKRCAETRMVRRVAARKGSEGVPIPGDSHAVAQAAAGDYHTVERLLAVEFRGRGGMWALVRWAADADDTWVRRRDLDGGSQRLADKMMRATGKAKAKPSFCRPPPQRAVAERQAVAERRRAVVRRLMGDGREVGVGRGGEGAPEDLGEGAEGRALKRGGASLRTPPRRWISAGMHGGARLPRGGGECDGVLDSRGYAPRLRTPP